MDQSDTEEVVLTDIKVVVRCSGCKMAAVLVSV